MADPSAPAQSHFAQARKRVAVVGHGPSIAEASQQAAFAAKCADNFFAKVYFVRDVPAWFDRKQCEYEVVNCDVNSESDRPPADGPSVFLYGTIGQKFAAVQRGWRSFFPCQLLNGAFFTGLQAIRYALEVADVAEIHTFGIDFDDSYIRRAWESTLNIPASLSQASSRAVDWLQLKSGVATALRELMNLMQAHNTVLVTSSQPLLQLIHAGTPVRLV
jgi:phosphohistidine phosphatase SixA